MTTATWWQRSALALAALVGLCGGAMAQTISGSDFSNGSLWSAYNGTYNANVGGGFMQLSYGIPTAVDDDAAVGFIGTFGKLSGLNMSFTSSDGVGTGNAPFAAFGGSVDNIWGGSAQRFEIIADSGNTLTGTSLVHVWNVTTNTNVNGLGLADNVTLNYVLSQSTGYNNVTFGNLDVMRAYAMIGDTNSLSSGSVKINSITVTPVPEPETFAMLLSGLGMMGFIGRRRSLKAAANA